MSRKLLIVAGVLVLLVGGGLAAIWKFEPFRTYNPPLGKVEFYRAEEEPAEGLTPIADPDSGKKLYRHKEPDLTSADIADVRMVAEKNDKLPAIAITFTKEGRAKSEKLSRNHFMKYVVIMVDGKVLSIPIIRGEVSREVYISGSFTEAELQNMLSQMLGK